MTNDKLADEIPAWVAEERAKRFVPWLLESLANEVLGNPIVKADAAKALAALRAERPQSGDMVMVPREATRHQIQLIFNTLMGELPEVKPDGWWGTSDQVAEAKKFYGELLAAAEAERGKT